VDSRVDLDEVAKEKIPSPAWNRTLVVQLLRLPIYLHWVLYFSVCVPQSKVKGMYYEGVSKSFRTGRLERELPLGAVVSLFCESA